MSLTHDQVSNFEVRIKYSHYSKSVSTLNVTGSFYFDIERRLERPGLLYYFPTSVAGLQVLVASFLRCATRSTVEVPRHGLGILRCNCTNSLPVQSLDGVRVKTWG